MPAVRVWTGWEACALRQALRMSVRGFAEDLGIAPRTVSNWERFGGAVKPRPDTQAILDTALRRADAEQQARFRLMLAESGTAALSTALAPQAWEHETWSDDLERAVVALSLQSFTAATRILDRWLGRYSVSQLDGGGLRLLARSMVLLGDALRDQGALVGPSSAHRSYRQALSLYQELDIPRRVAQIELSLAVITEMTGSLRSAARIYDDLAADERLSERDRARSRLWVGTALDKDGNHDYAARVVTEASRAFEDLGETEDWATAQQKLALAYRGSGELDKALHFIDLAHTSGTIDTPMQRVRLDTAHAHILLSDKATCDHGLNLLDNAAHLAAASGLAHQVRSIQAIRHSFEHACNRPDKRILS